MVRWQSYQVEKSQEYEEFRKKQKIKDQPESWESWRGGPIENWEELQSDRGRVR